MFLQQIPQPSHGNISKTLYSVHNISYRFIIKNSSLPIRPSDKLTRGAPPAGRFCHHNGTSALSASDAMQKNTLHCKKKKKESMFLAEKKIFF